MSGLIVSSVGDIELDLHTDMCPLTTKNFLKLCKTKYYNGCLFHKVERDIFAQTGTGLELPEEAFKTGTLAMAIAGDNFNASLAHLFVRSIVGFGTFSEGLHTLAKINEAYVDEKEDHLRHKVGDIPGVEVKPPDIVLFVCKLDPVTQDEDFYTIFSCFGTVELAEIIRDLKTGDSLCYAFIDFEAKEACERAYFKVDSCLIDDPIGSMLILVKVFQNCGVSSEKANEMQIKGVTSSIRIKTTRKSRTTTTKNTMKRRTTTTMLTLMSEASWTTSTACG